MFQFICVLTHPLLIFIILICVLFFILLSTFRACMGHYFVLWRHTQFLLNGFSSVLIICACVCCSVTVLTKSGTAKWGGVGGWGRGDTCPHQYFLNYKELVRKSVLCPPNIQSCPPPPNLKVSPRSLKVGGSS